MARTKKKDTAAELAFEDALARLESIVTELEQGDNTLDDALQNFADGMALSKLCLQKLQYAQQQIDTIIKEEHGEMIEQPLRIQEGE